MTPTPKRRRFRYSLRTLFVMVTVVCVWLGWNVPQLTQRHRMLNARGVSGSSFNLGRKSFPISWWLLGEKPIDIIYISTWLYDEDDKAQYQAAFPEALFMETGGDYCQFCRDVMIDPSSPPPMPKNPQNPSATQ
jgi:hypothetical protein